MAGAIHRWDLVSFNPQERYRHHLYENLGFSEIVAHPDGQTFFTSGYGGQVDEWDFEVQDHPIWEEVRYVGNFSIAISTSGEWLASGNIDGAIQLWNFEQDTYIELDELEQTVFTLDFSLQEDLLAASSSDYSDDSKNANIYVWNLETLAINHILEGHTGRINDLKFHPTRPYIVSVSADGSLRVWDIISGNIIAEFKNNTYSFTSLAINNNGSFALAGTETGDILQIDIETGHLIQSLGSHSARVNSVALTSDNMFAVSASDDTSVIVWELSTGRAIRRFTGVSAMTGVAIDSNGETIIASGQLGALLTWPLHTAETLVTWIEDNRYVRPLTCQERLQYNLTSCVAPSLQQDIPITVETMPQELIFYEDFSTTNNWVNIDPASLVIDTQDNRLEWDITRRKYQVMFAPLPPLDGVVRLRFNAQFKGWQANNSLRIGFVETFTQSYNASDRPTGVFVEIGRFGGGTRYINVSFG